MLSAYSRGWITAVVQSSIIDMCNQLSLFVNHQPGSPRLQCGMKGNTVPAIDVLPAWNINVTVNNLLEIRLHGEQLFKLDN